MTIIKMAWRNLWRNPKRTAITGSAIAIGLATMIFYLGWMGGMTLHLVHTMTSSQLGYAQIHADGYISSREPELTIKKPADILERLKSRKGVIGAAPRIYGDGLLAIGDRSTNVTCIGYEEAQEKLVSGWSENLTSGGLPAGEREILVGVDLAEKLEIEVGSKVVLTIADIYTGDLNYILVKIAGILATNNPVIDKQAALMGLSPLQKALGIGDDIHEVALSLDVSPTDLEGIKWIIAPFNTAKTTAKPWQELVPVVANMVKLQSIYMGITLVIVFTLIAFGIVNTLSMSLLERMKEFGVLRALGTTPLRLAALVICEGAWLGVVGSSLGLFLGLIVHFILSKTGITMGNAEAMGVTFRSPIYPILDPTGIAVVTALFITLTPLVSLIVAKKAEKVDPIKALRHE